ncbi:FHA domain-containing protein [Streptomyces sp. NPDC003247]|uniref:FHA domain-containing protein n=1 Tax=Streptomyces sp. NPDC003247 TaxID=3364677 RepID=UPI0036C9AB94
MDRALTDDDDPLIDDDQEAYVPPPPVSTDIPAPRTETPEAPEAPRGGGAATGRAYGPAAPPYAPTSPYAPAAPPVDAARRVRPCWQCGHPLPPGTSSCPECLEPTRHLRLIGSRPRLDLRHGEGAPLRLGRHPVWARPEVFGALQCEREVSRCHAVVQLAPDGTLWLTENPRGTANGTYVNHERIPRGGRVRLEDGDVIGLGEKVAFTVLLPDPAG